MQDRESAVDAHGVALLRNGTIGAFVNKGARTAFRNCAFTFNGSTGAETRDRNSSITMRHCSVTHNGRVGVYAHSAASVLLRSCRVEENGTYGLLCGGRHKGDIGGGCAAVEAGTVVTGGTQVRHGGRVFVQQPKAGEAAATGVPGGVLR